MAANDDSQDACFYRERLHTNHQELCELNDAISQKSNDSTNDSCLNQVIEKILNQFSSYVEKRTQLIRADISQYLSPTWCNSVERSVLWIGGCRPSSFIRLVYVLCGREIESRLNEFLQGARTGNLGELSANQLSKVDDLQGRTISQERKISSRMASLQEEVLDHPLVAIALESSGKGCDTSREELEEALHKHSGVLVEILEEADRLRLDTVKEIVSILTPPQAVSFLAAGKKVRLCMNEWGRKIDLDHGRTVADPYPSC